MERATTEHFGRSSLKHEHVHRYTLAARVANGFVVDCACGIGYGSEILCRQPAVAAYLGVDPSAEALATAFECYAAPGVDFRAGTLEALPCPHASIDTFVMFETLEHTVDPALAIAAVCRHLAVDGLLIGSVPSAAYEALCEQTYGSNPYHLQRFTVESLTTLLAAHFEVVHLLSAEFVLGTLVCDLSMRGNAMAGKIVTSKDDTVAGSLIFIAGTTMRVAAALRDLGGVPQFLAGMPKVALDAEEVEPIRAAFQKTEAMVQERDKALIEQVAILNEYRTAMRSMEAMICERDRVVATQAMLLDEHRTAIQAMRTVVGAHGEALSALTWAGDIDAVLAAFDNETLPFADMAFSLHLFTDRLLRVAREHGVRDLLFFAREGQLLKEMFDLQQSLSGDVSIRTHYLRVSRRSTFLLSLGPLEDETFEVLFRQYRRISIQDFLRSLDLDEHAVIFARALGGGAEIFNSVCEDLPTDPSFISLLRLEEFRTIYEIERCQRASAFERHLTHLLATDRLPDALHVVDVGWKGSIQDNLYNWFKRVRGVEVCVDGYYVGLIATGAMSTFNRKAGLLFSNIEEPTQGFKVFNENRSLFEIVLHADHGSARRYVTNADGSARVIEDVFDDGEMIARFVAPVATAVMVRFRVLAITAMAAGLSDAKLLEIALKRHASMVFHPSHKEIDWMLTVTHVENFGVFEASCFTPADGVAGFVGRLKFTYHLLWRRRLSGLGFWPWLTIRSRALPGMAMLYGIVRRRQGL